MPYTHKVPIKLLGWDAAEILHRWMAAIDAQRRGEPVTHPMP